MTGTLRGKLLKPITIATNDREHLTARVDCEAEIRSALRCEPDSVHIAPIKRSDSELQRIVHIKRGDAGPITPKVLSTSNPQITAELREVQAGESYDLVVTARPPWPTTNLIGNVQIETGVSEVPTERINVIGNVSPRVQALPPRFTIRPGHKAGDRLSARVAWDGDNPGRVLTATVSDPALTTRIEERSGQQTIWLEVPASYNLEAGKTAMVTVTTDDPAVPTFQIPVAMLPAQAATPSGAAPAAAARGTK
jgi:hypothetical protein